MLGVSIASKLTSCIVVLAFLSFVHGINRSGANGGASNISAGFSWHTFLEVNPHIVKEGVNSISKFSLHNTTIGYTKFQVSEASPELGSFQSAVAKFRKEMTASKRGGGKRNLVIYHIEDIGLNDNNLEVAFNNVKVFVASILHHHQPSDQSAFYLFNVAGLNSNAAKEIIPTHLKNVAAVDWVISPNPLYSFLQTVLLLDQDALSLVDVVFHLSSGVRGPLVHHKNAAWIGEFRHMLDASNVGMVGPIISCLGVPHVQTHAFALKTQLLPQIKMEIQRYYESEDFVPIEEHFQQRLARAVQESNMLIASLYHAKRFASDVFQPKFCTDMAQTAQNNPLSVCETNAEDLIFVRWSGEHLGAKGFQCGKGIAMSEANQVLVRGLTSQVALLPEVASGGPYADLYKEYSLEHLREQRAMAALASKAAAERTKGVASTPATASATTVLPEDSQVCFLVRTAKMHDPTYVSPKTGKIRYVEMDLEVFAKCKCCV